MASKCYLVYPCGKKIEVRVPIYIYNNNIRSVILPNNPEYFRHAKQKFEINNIKVIEEVNVKNETPKDLDFISLYDKKRSIE